MKTLKRRGAGSAGFLRSCSAALSPGGQVGVGPFRGALGCKRESPASWGPRRNCPAGSRLRRHIQSWLAESYQLDQRPRSGVPTDSAHGHEHRSQAVRQLVSVVPCKVTSWAFTPFIAFPYVARIAQDYVPCSGLAAARKTGPILNPNRALRAKLLGMGAPPPAICRPSMA